MIDGIIKQVVELIIQSNRKGYKKGYHDGYHEGIKKGIEEGIKRSQNKYYVWESEENERSKTQGIQTELPTEEQKSL